MVSLQTRLLRNHFFAPNIFEKFVRDWVARSLTSLNRLIIFAFMSSVVTSVGSPMAADSDDAMSLFLQNATKSQNRFPVAEESANAQLTE